MFLFYSYDFTFDFNRKRIELIQIQCAKVLTFIALEGS